jgi:hypothetical protein
VWWQVARNTVATATPRAYPRFVGDAPAPPPPPVAIRITRPYGSEDEYLERELETLSRASITLLGAQSRPQGVVLRFELALSSGQVLMRGEGRVVGFKANAFEGLGGLTLRFTRLDTRSKALVDKAAALREKRRPSTRPAMADPAEPPADRPSAAEPPGESGPRLIVGPDSAPSLAPQPPPAAITPPLFVPDPPAAPAPAPSEPAPPHPRAGEQAHASAEAPPGRDMLLDRLRARARALNPGDIERILAARRRA